MATYLEGLDKIASAKRSTARVFEVLGSAHIVPKSTAIGSFVSSLERSAEPDVKDGIGTVVGIGAGLYYGYKRGFPIRGAFQGASLGRNLPALLKPELRRDALCKMAQTTTAVLTSFAAGHSPTKAAVAFAAGWLASGAVIYFGNLRG